MDTFAKLKSWINEKSLCCQFSNLGEIIARHPLYFLIIPIIITAALSTGFLRMEINRDHDWLYTDIYGEAAKNQHLIRNLFPVNTSLYNDYTRMVSTAELSMVLIVAKDGGSILREDIVNDILALDQTIKSIEVEWEGRMVNYSVLCAKVFGGCAEDSIEVISRFEEIRRGKYMIKYPIILDKLTYTYKAYGALFGSVKVSGDGYLEDAKAVRIGYFYDLSDRTKLQAIVKWENLLYNYIMNNDWKHLDIGISSDSATYESTKAITLAMMKVFPVVIGVTIIFSALACITNEWATSRPWLGILACVSALLAIISGFGLVFFFGIPYIEPLLLVMYIVLATEIDDAFMFLSSWRTTNPSDTVAKRMRQTFSETATSVTVSSLTNITSCCVGIQSTVPSFRIVCSTAACCGVFAYVYQITFFGACLALSGYNEQRCMVSAIYANNERKNEATVSKIKKGDFFMLFLKNSIGDLLSYSLVKIIVVLVFLANLAVGIWGCFHIKYGLGIKDIFPVDSAVAKTATMRYRYLSEFPLAVQVIFKDTLNYADSKVQSSIEALMTQFESHPHIADSQLRISWLRFYNDVSEIHPVGKMVFRGYNMSDKQDFIDGLRHVFLRMNNALQFNFDIKFNENYTDIVASRFIVLTKDVNSTEVEVETIKALYEIASKSDLPVEIFGFTFHWLEQVWIVKGVMLQTASLAVGLSCLIFLIFSQNIRSALCVAFVVLCIICEMIGYASLWGTGIDFVSLTVFIVSVGFSINYPAHMSFSLITTDKLEPNERIKTSIYRIGVPLIQGALSTVFGLFVLIFQPLYVLIACFKVLCLISVLTVFHSLFFIPVVLYYSGTCTKPQHRRDAECVPLK